jgi:hypothetical protein
MPARVRRHLRGDGIAGALAAAAGWASGRVLAVRHMVPGVAGAAALSVAAGEVAGHVFGHGLTPWVGLGVGALFALALDRRI